jgi:hypothetical protein
MDLIHDGFGNYGDFEDKLREVLAAKVYEYIVCTRSDNGAGTLGGQSLFKIQGTNYEEELEKPEVFQNATTIYDTILGVVMEKKELAAQYITSLSPEEKETLRDRMLADYLCRK